eukprot:gb/GEZN01009543.1/.p1 GENE.gb/GEZN01009543.1/~~gb/GEZN01009543.1/.p1  ORF type:complete len:392 (-),score=50.05 gb/GEZN01009543.1/:100-1275(-)
MNFFFKHKAESSLPELKNKQIESLLTQNPAARQLDPSRNCYELTVTTKFGQLPFRIVLGPQFPEEAPQILVPTPVIHPWVDRNYNVVGHPSLQQWTPRNDLGRIAKEIFQEFFQNPPTPHISASVQAPTPSPLPAITAVPVRPSPSPDGPSLSRKVSNRVQPPQIPAKFDELQALSETELEQLANDEDYLKDFALSLKSTKDLLLVRDDLYLNVKQTAENNLAREPEVIKLQEEVVALRSQAAESQNTLDALRLRQQIAAERYSPENVLHLLKLAIDKAEHEADQLRESYKDQSEDENSDGDAAAESDSEDGEDGGSSKKKKKKTKKLTPMQFASQYVKLRKVVHELSAKRERLKEDYARDMGRGRGNALPIPARPRILLGGPDAFSGFHQ